MKAGHKAGYTSACAGSMFYFTGKKGCVGTLCKTLIWCGPPFSAGKPLDYEGV